MRRKRNRKRRVEGFAFPVPVAGGAIALAALALSFLWLDSRCKTVGSEIKELEKQKAELSKRHVNEEYRWAQLKSPRNMEKALSKWNIEMKWPSPSQVERLRDVSKRDVEKVLEGEYYPSVARR